MSTVSKKVARRAAPLAERVSRIRWKVQLLSLVGLNSLWLQSWRAHRLHGVCLPVLNCHGCPLAATNCPVGVVGDMLNLRIVPWLAMGTFGLIGLLFGRLSCGWVCPFGFLQDLLAKVRVPKWNPPRWTTRIKYVVLVGMVIVAPLTIGTDTNWFFCGICPNGTLAANGWYYGTARASIPLDRLLFLGGFLALMVVVKRGFCRLVCPIGAGLALFNRVSLLSIKFKRRFCSECMQCVRVCPVDQGPMAHPRDPECVYCLDCLVCTGLEINGKDK